ncbi:carboxylesterase/lipase family protein [Pedobacter sp. MR2016-24]|uniref:carboxylesterase/lipase family protein n=1 Tax=Pedobacter sp. MR2016-24 TaxID=2994466 RepID=UPI002247DDC6|nr:carboxylesterase family protein [Pedobacter sp. MR2016-24]MCX2483438.1 carboxylesterase family protein [Pedobacter sp. MR2016-24]
MKAFILLTLLIPLTANTFAQEKNASGETPVIRISNGALKGTISQSGVRAYKGIPFAQPPVGNLRWKEPQPAKNWKGVLKADHFGSNGMQKPVFGDMGFRSSGMSEDCLYLNVWTPAKSAAEKLPVLVYFYGGGYVAGDGSERRYDGEAMATTGIVTLTVNYRLGVFGFLSHPELTKESAHHASGNYGLLDQQAALQWVKDNIAAFGGDPSRVTIAGESAGSISVSAQMASPLSKSLIAGAIGESGAMINPTLAPVTLKKGEENGVAFAGSVKAKSLADLRAMPAAVLLEAASKPGAFSTAATVDGYFLPELPATIFAKGQQANVPLLAGWNSAEVPYQALLREAGPTLVNYKNKLKELYPEQAEEVLKLYPAATDAEVVEAATALASDRFIVYSTWKWLDLHRKTGNKPVYSYIFSQGKPPVTDAMKGVVPGLAGGVKKADAKTAAAAVAPAPAGAPHAFEIEYAMGNLDSNKMYAWTLDDHRVSSYMRDYFSNFIKTGNPNSDALPVWEPIQPDSAAYMNINADSKQKKEVNRARYLFLDKIYAQ